MDHFVTHLRVVAALMIREMSARFGNKPGGYVWALVEPAGHIVFLTLIFSAITRAPALGTSFPLFFATGYIAFQFYAAIVGYVSNAVKSNRALLGYPNVAPIDAISSRFFLQLLTTTAVSILVLSSILIFVSKPINLNWIAILEAVTCASFLGLGVSLANNVLFTRFPIYDQIFSIVTKPLFLISGVFFLPDAIPHPYREVVLYNPLVHVLMRFRQGFYPEYRAIGLDMDFLYLTTMCSLLIGLTIFRFSHSVLRGR